MEDNLWGVCTCTCAMSVFFPGLLKFHWYKPSFSAAESHLIVQERKKKTNIENRLFLCISLLVRFFPPSLRTFLQDAQSAHQSPGSLFKVFSWFAFFCLNFAPFPEGNLSYPPPQATAKTPTCTFNTVAKELFNHRCVAPYLSWSPSHSNTASSSTFHGSHTCPRAVATFVPANH